jgi:hypothetical protein
MMKSCNVGRCTTFVYESIYVSQCCDEFGIPSLGNNGRTWVFLHSVTFHMTFRSKVPQPSSGWLNILFLNRYVLAQLWLTNGSKYFSGLFLGINNVFQTVITKYLIRKYVLCVTSQSSLNIGKSETFLIYLTMPSVSQKIQVRME